MNEVNQLYTRTIESLNTDQIGFWKTIIDDYQIKMKKKYESFYTPHIFSKYDIWYYNKHDFHHILKVCNTIDALIEHLNLSMHVEELLILLFSAIGHDVSMADISIERQVDYQHSLNRWITGDDWRRKHSIRSAEIVKNYICNYTDTNKDNAEILLRIIRPIHEIISKHEKYGIPIQESSNSNIRKPLLFALLKIADRYDSTADRLPNDEIIGNIIALSSTVGESLDYQINHYLRRLINTNVKLVTEDNEPLISLEIMNSFINQKIVTPIGTNGVKKTFFGTDGFIGLIEEFYGELGKPINYNDKDLSKYIRSAMNNVGDKKSNTSTKILNKYNLKLKWKIDVIPYEGDIDEKIITWQNKAKHYRQLYDLHPHKWEQHSNLKNIKKKKEEIEQLLSTEYIDNLLLEIKRKIPKSYIQSNLICRNSNIKTIKIGTEVNTETLLNDMIYQLNSNLLIVLGNFGSGKSSLCYSFIQHHTNTNQVSNKIPILIELNKHNNETELNDIIISEIQKHVKFEINESLFNTLNMEGKFIIILDGLNEFLPYGRIDRLYKFIKSINDIITDKSLIILTCRSEFFRDLQELINVLNTFSKSVKYINVEICKLSDRQIQNYLINEFDSDGKEYWKRLSENNKLLQLARKPLLLFLLKNYIMKKGISDFTQSLTKIYENCIRVELTRKLLKWPGKKVVIEYRDRRRLMENLALWMFQNEENKIYYSNIETLLKFDIVFGELPKTILKRYIHDFLTCSFLIRDDEGYYTFYHNSFIDYFIGQIIQKEIKSKIFNYLISLQLSDNIITFININENGINKLLKAVNNSEYKGHLKLNTKLILQNYND